MNHSKFYKQITDRAQSENRVKGDMYYESHHIIPKSLGGNNKKENRVLLTAKEHFICHCLLVHIHKQDQKAYIKMLQALYMMKSKHKHHKRYLNANLYEKCKNKLYGENGLLKGENHYFYGKSHSQEVKNILSEKKKLHCANPIERKRLKDMALNRSEEHKAKIIASNTGQKRSLESRKKMSDVHKNLQINEKNVNSKKCEINGVVYPSAREAHRQLGGNVYTLYGRINSNKFSEYKWL